MRDTTGIIIAFIGLVILVLAQLTGIGVWLYTWNTGVALNVSMWTGFVAWLKMMGIGSITFIIGMILRD